MLNMKKKKTLTSVLSHHQHYYDS